MKNSPEYEILKFLNDRIEDYDIWEKDLKKHLQIPDHEIQETVKNLKEINYVSNKTSPDHEKGLTITTEGQKRYGRLHTEISENKRVRAINWIALIGLAFTLSQICLTYCNLIETREANHYSKERNDISERSLRIDSIAKNKEQKSFQSNEVNAIRMKDTALVRIVK